MAQTIQVLAPGTYGPGDRTIPSRSIPDSITGGMLAVDITAHSDPSVRIELCFDISLDGGATWIGNGTMSDCYAGAARDGGPVIQDRNGVDITAMTIHRQLPAGTGRRIRGRVRIIGGSIATSATLTTEP